MVQGAVRRSTQMRQRLRQHVARVLVVDGVERKTNPVDRGNDPETMLNSESLAMRRDVHLRVSRVLTSQSFSTIPDRFGLSHSHPLLSVKLLESCTNQTPSRLTAAALFGGVLGGLSPTLPQPEKRIGDEQPVTCTPPGKKKLRARSLFLIRRGPLDVIDHDVYRGNLRRDELKAKRSQVQSED